VKCTYEDAPVELRPLGRSGAIDEDEFAVVVKRLFKNTELSRLAEEQVHYRTASSLSSEQESQGQILDLTVSYVPHSLARQKAFRLKSLKPFKLLPLRLDEFAVVVKRLFKNTQLSRLAEEQVRNLPNALARDLWTFQ